MQRPPATPPAPAAWAGLGWRATPPLRTLQGQVAPGASAKEPTGHASQSITWCAPLRWPAVPAGQPLQVVAPSALCQVPRGQGAQLRAPSMLEKCPLGHGWQASEVRLMKVPAWQAGSSSASSSGDGALTAAAAPASEGRRPARVTIG